MDYKNRWAIVTGASSGIGECFANQLAQKGVNLILVARRDLSPLSEQLKKQYAIEVDTIQLDLATVHAPQELFDRVTQLNRPVSILINNAGVGTTGHLHETKLSSSANLIMLNVYALSLITQLFLPKILQERNGLIINVASIAAFQPLPYMANYGASKAFVLSFTEALWAEYADRDIRILALCPGPVKTEFFKAMGTSDKHFGKLQTPDVVVKAAFDAVEKNKGYVIPGSKNYWLAHLNRFVPRPWVAKISGAVLRNMRHK